MCFEHELSVLIIWSDSSSSRQFSHPFLPSFHCLFSVTGACFPFLHGGSCGEHCNNLGAGYSVLHRF